MKLQYIMYNVVGDPEKPLKSLFKTFQEPEEREKKLIILWGDSFECKRKLSYLTDFAYFVCGKILIR